MNYIIYINKYYIILIINIDISVNIIYKVTIKS